MNGVCLNCKTTFTKNRVEQKFCSVTCSNNYNLNNKKVFIAPKGNSKELAELFGILLGDGSVTKYYVKIYLNAIADQGYSDTIVKLASKVLPKVRVTRTVRIDRGTEEIQISSSDVSRYFTRLGFDPKKRTVPAWIIKNDPYTKAAIRGLFDTEGSIGHKVYEGKNGTSLYKQLTFTNKNLPLVLFVQDSLSRFGFTPTKTMKQNIYISNKSDIERYFKLIGTNNPKLEKKFKMTTMPTVAHNAGRRG